MKIILCLSFLGYFTLTSTQMVPYPMSGAHGAISAANLPNIITTGGSMASHMQPSNMQYSSAYAQSPANMQTANYLANANAASAMTNPHVVNPNIVVPNVEHNEISLPVHSNLGAANIANANAMANAVSTANAIIAADNAANNIINAYENALATAEEIKLNNPSPVLNGNMATFYLGNNGNTFTVTSGSPGSQGIGVQIMADALEVGGTVAVNGKIPIYGMVGINGNIPTDGMASVSYSCANPSNLLYSN